MQATKATTRHTLASRMQPSPRPVARTTRSPAVQATLATTPQRTFPVTCMAVPRPAVQFVLADTEQQPSRVAHDHAVQQGGLITARPVQFEAAKEPMLPCNSLNDEQLRQGHEQALFKGFHDLGSPLTPEQERKVFEWLNHPAMIELFDAHKGGTTNNLRHPQEGHRAGQGAPLPHRKVPPLPYRGIIMRAAKQYFASKGFTDFAVEITLRLQHGEYGGDIHADSADYLGRLVFRYPQDGVSDSWLDLWLDMSHRPDGQPRYPGYITSIRIPPGKGYDMSQEASRGKYQHDVRPGFHGISIIVTAKKKGSRKGSKKASKEAPSPAKPQAEFGGRSVPLVEAALVEDSPAVKQVAKSGRGKQVAKAAS